MKRKSDCDDSLKQESAIDLVHVSDSQPGISRRLCGSGFSYRHADGSLIRDVAILNRIKALAIPPAYHQVWICENANGHLQATGIDSRGRKQYRYHPAFREHQECQKFGRLLQFGRALPALRERVSHDLAAPGFPKKKVIAAIIRLLDKSLVRIGNEEYASTNASFGLTTLRNRHIHIEGSELTLSFTGKSHIRHRVRVRDAKLSRFVRELQDLPGQELFQYVDATGSIISVSSTDVNAYLAEICDKHFTAKDFRTWWGTVLCLGALERQAPPESKRELARVISQVMKEVSGHLGNTPAICRKCYVHPFLIESFSAGTLCRPLDFQDCDAESLLIEILGRSESHSETACARTCA